MQVDSNTLALLATLVTIVLPLALALGKVLVEFMLARLPAAKAADVRQVIAEVVAAVEQANQSVPGVQKRQIAEQLLGVISKQRHLPTLAPEQASVLIEAAVRALHIAQDAATPPVLPATPASLKAPPQAS